jgi:hypothetical protein
LRTCSQIKKFFPLSSGDVQPIIAVSMPRNILEAIHSIGENNLFEPSHELAQIARIARRFAPILSEIIED